MQSNHPEKIASECTHRIHFLSHPRTSWCPRCITSTAQADLGRARKRLEAEGGANAPVYMRDRAWNVARLQYTITKGRVERTMQKDWLRQERERVWDDKHQQYLAEYGVLPPESSFRSVCVVCATIRKLSRPYAKPTVALTTAWWEGEGALVADHILVPRTPPRSMTSGTGPSQPQPKSPSGLRNLIQSYRDMKTVSDVHKQAWENRCKIDRAIRRKYDLTNDFNMDPNFLTLPIPASHARYHHRQTQDGLCADKRRANRHKQRAGGYKPSRSSLGLSELAENVRPDDEELEELRLKEVATELRWLTNVVATEVGYLYFVGDVGLLERWRDDVEQSNLSLVYRKFGTKLEMEQLEERHTKTEEAEEEEL